MPRINLLPPEIRVRQRERRLLVAVASAGGVVLVVLLFLLWVAIMRVNNEEETLQALQTQRDRVAADVASLQQFEVLEGQVTQTRTTLASALTGDVAWSRFLNDLSLMMPDDSWLTSLSLQAQPGAAPNGEVSFGTATFQGFVFDFPGLAGWLTRIDRLEGLTFLYLGSGIKQDLVGRKVISFSATGNINQAMLSLRCTEGKRCP